MKTSCPTMAAWRPLSRRQQVARWSSCGSGSTGSDPKALKDAGDRLGMR